MISQALKMWDLFGEVVQVKKFEISGLEILEVYKGSPLIIIFVHYRTGLLLVYIGFFCEFDE